MATAQAIDRAEYPLCLVGPRRVDVEIETARVRRQVANEACDNQSIAKATGNFEAEERSLIARLRLDIHDPFGFSLVADDAPRLPDGDWYLSYDQAGDIAEG